MNKVSLFFAIAFLTIVWSCMTDHNTPSAVRYQLDETMSVAEWKGYLRTGYFNEGAISVQSQNLMVNDGKVASGSFTIPVSSIVNFNLPTDSIKHVLVHHLQSPDFFNMAMHPNLTYDITSVTPYSGTGGLMGANYQVNGSLMMLGQTNPVNFPARIDLVNNQILVDATLKIDRTKWGITYASDPSLPADGQILPDIDIHLKLTGNKL